MKPEKERLKQYRKLLKKEIITESEYKSLKSGNGLGSFEQSDRPKTRLTPLARAIKQAIRG